jgi:hypothetical protein
MSFPLARLLLLPSLAIACSAQATTPTKAEILKEAKRLAASFRFQRFHPDAARGFAKIGPIGLPIVERALREGTIVEARGALSSLIVMQGETDRIISQLEWVHTHRPKVLAVDKGDAVLLSYLRRKLRTNSRAVDALWSMLGGEMHVSVVSALVRARKTRSTILRLLVRDLDSGDEKRVARAVGYLVHASRYGPVPVELKKAITALFADESGDLTTLRKLSASTDRVTKFAAQEFLKTYNGIKVTRANNKRALEQADRMDTNTRISLLIGMLDVNALRHRAIEELAELNSQALPLLEGALVHPKAIVAEGAMRALTKMKPQVEKGGILIGKVVADKTFAVEARITGMQFLAETMDSDALMFVVVRNRTDESEPAPMRIAAIRELAQTEKRRHDVVNLLEKVLRSKQLEVVEYATMTLGSMAKKEDQRIVMMLTRQLQSPHANVQRAAIVALGGKGAKIHLERLLKKPDLDASVKTVLERVLAQKKELVGFLIADYSENRIVQIDLKGEQVSSIEEIFGVWDVELLDNGNYLITEFSVNRISEVTPDNKTVWSFTDLKNPYDADRLPNGNTLIADTFGRRVIEVDKAGKIVWKYDNNIHPYDADRLPNGNTLISDNQNSRVFEVDRDGETVWEANNLRNVHDADRLPNGNTLVTIRVLNQVREIDRTGKTVFTLPGLNSPSDADRLPDGRTITAENGLVRIFNPRGKEVWRKRITWAVEINPVWKYQLAAQKKARAK